MKKGQKASKETRQRIAEAKRRWWAGGNWTKEMSRKRSEIATRINTGRKLSEQAKGKISKSLVGRKTLVCLL